MSDMKRCSAEVLRNVTQKILEAPNTRSDVAARVAAILVNANLSGHDSHGVLRISTFRDQIQRGVLVPDADFSILQESASTAQIDANLGWGHYTAWEAMELAMKKARETGVAAVAVARCNHIGRLGEYVEQAAAEGMASLVTIGMAGPGIGGAAPFGGVGRMLGTNPWAFGVPTAEDPPIVVDFATTVIAEGKIQVARSKGDSLPDGCILDTSGNPSTKTEDYYSGGTILHAGGHKGYALSLVACLLGGLAGSMEPWLKHFKLDDPGWTMGGVFMTAFDVSRFQGLDTYRSDVSNVVSGLKTATLAPGFSEILAPGEPEYRAREQRKAAGIEIPDSIWSELTEACQELGVTMIEEEG